MSAGSENFGPPVVETVDVHHHYGEGPQRTDVLFDINMQVREGELLIVTGPSGSGKTTLLTILGTMRRPSEGKLRLLGADIVNMQGRALDVLRNRIRFLFQKRNLLSSLTALQNVMAGVSTTPLSDPDWDEPRARHLLGLLGLADKIDSWPDELSGGQQQRVAIARVMIGLPDLIIADEPTSALDRVAGRLVVDQLKDLAMRAKCAVVLSTHDERIFDVASRRLHIEDGRCFEVPIHYH
ncbi:ABC transporter ATP-binding protein [Reyranella sp.]|uniref:ABC transporter ATP-binding protein n=1 Tax=Reyranella sp. TaxID=1929291 RepID=UPI003782D2CE